MRLRIFFYVSQSEKDIHTELATKQRELLELKKRKLELELAATQKQLATTAPPVQHVTHVPHITHVPHVPHVPHAAIVDPIKMLNSNELLNRDALHAIVPKPAGNVIAQPPYIPNHIPPPNVRTRIAPVNPALVSSVRSRDPRLMRQPPPTVPIPPSVITQSINEHIQQQKLPSK